MMKGGGVDILGADQCLERKCILPRRKQGKKDVPSAHFLP